MGQMPQSAKDDLREMLEVVSECPPRSSSCTDPAVGFFGKADWRKNHAFLPRKPKTFAEFASTASFPTLQ